METSTKNCRLDLIGLFVSSEPLTNKKFCFLRLFTFEKKYFLSMPVNLHHSVWNNVFEGV